MKSRNFREKRERCKGKGGGNTVRVARVSGKRRIHENVEILCHQAYFGDRNKGAGNFGRGRGSSTALDKVGEMKKTNRKKIYIIANVSTLPPLFNGKKRQSPKLNL